MISIILLTATGENGKNRESQFKKKKKNQATEKQFTNAFTEKNAKTQDYIYIYIYILYMKKKGLKQKIIKLQKHEINKRN